MSIGNDWGQDLRTLIALGAAGLVLAPGIGRSIPNNDTVTTTSTRRLAITPVAADSI
jgi:hypothetical protein